MNDQSFGYRPTTTHASWGAGNPHLRITGGDEDRVIFELTEHDITIGSDQKSALVLPGADPLHARIIHDERDEYVLTMFGTGEMSSVQDASDEGPRSTVLRTGTRFTIGEWLLVFGREEFADHGRPYGGRQGGEGGHQVRQPDRPEYPVPPSAPPSAPPTSAAADSADRAES